MPLKPRLPFTPSRDAWLMALLGLVIAVQLAAFWMVCQSQVRNAQARHANLLVEQRAVEDCVRRNATGSLISCADRATDQHPAAATTAKPGGSFAAVR